jgi:GT2 family glycosyltransferase
MPKVSIHLVTWNGRKYIEECLNSIFKQVFDEYFLLIIDNGSVDETTKIINNQFVPLFKDKIRFVQNKDNLGFARAHNQALLWTDSEYVLVLNQDVILDEGFLAEMVEFMDQNPKIGSASSKILRWEFENTEDLKKSKKSDIIDSLGLKIFKNQRVIDLASGEKDLGQYDENQPIFGVSGTCPFYRKKSLEEIRYEDEYFDNDFFSYKEDVDIAYRLQWRGWPSYYVNKAVAYHDRTAQSREKISDLKMMGWRKHKSKFINYHSYKNHLFVLQKNLSAKNYQRYFPHILFYEFRKIVYLLIFEWSTLKGLKEYFRKKKKIKVKRKFIMKNRLIKDEEMRKWYF